MSDEQSGTEYGRDTRPDRGPAEPERVVVRDRRRIDPLTGEVRPPEGEQPAGAGPAGAGAPGSS
ncbi:MAG: hypothetical protein QOI68_1629, partial [Pseudonocardiales bacterium]|nr:hypothetical protein [Pseudonocardiales bacterium]